MSLDLEGKLIEIQDLGTGKHNEKLEKVGKPCVFQFFPIFSDFFQFFIVFSNFPMFLTLEGRLVEIPNGQG